MNKLNKWLNDKGLTSMIYNDGFIKTSVGKFDKNIVVTYWSYDGMQEDERPYRAKLGDVLDSGYSAFNIPFEPTYYCPCSEEDRYTAAEMAEQVASWNISEWDPEEPPVTSNLERIIGSGIYIWSEDATEMSDEKIYQYGEERIKALIKNVKEN